MAQLQLGDEAPDFTAVTSAGDPICLSDYRGKKAVALFFYPQDGTPVCTAQACAFRDVYQDLLQLEVVVIGVSGSDNNSHERFIAAHNLPFPLISDPRGELQKLYGVAPYWGLIPQRTTFLIDREGSIQLKYSALFSSDEHVKQVIAAVSRLRSQE